MNNNQLKFATINVGGSLETENFVEKRFSESKCAVVGVTETHCRMRGKVRCGYAQIGAPRPEDGNRACHGGVALLFAQDVAFRLLFKHAEKNFQIVVARVRNMNAAVVYIAPSANLEASARCLKLLQTHCRGPTAIMGDWNARHRKWDKLTKSRGTQLYNWCASNKWTTSAIDGFSYQCNTGESNIDLFASKDIVCSRASSPRGPWDGAINHKPVTCTVESPGNISEEKRRMVISNSRLKDKEYREKVRDGSKADLLTLSMRFNSCNSEQELNMLCTRTEEELCRPWLVPLRLTNRFRGFWNNELDQMAKKRTRLSKRRRGQKTRESLANTSAS